VTRSLKLEAELVEIILEASANETTFSELRYLLSYAGLPHHTLKKYLFFLIEYNLICYEGRDKVFVITKDGWNLLSTTARTGVKKIALE
jgi:predicted transcriptional regulator